MLTEGACILHFPPTMPWNSPPHKHLSGQYRPELGYRSIENFTVAHFHGQHRPLRGGVGSRFRCPLTGKTGALKGKWVGNAKHQRNQLLYIYRKD